MGLNVLSLFDGMSCGRLALERAGLDVEMYFSSEVDKYAIQVADANYPVDKWTRLGDVREVDTSIFPEIDLLIGGSPCQSFSFAGKRKGMSTKCDIEITTLEQYMALREEGFEFQGQSYLFWEYMRILRDLKPKYFLLENVVMTKKWERVLSDAIGVEPIMINSALLSAQNRKRLYWTNIPNVTQPEDLGLVLNDILEDGEGLGATMRGRYIVDGKRQDHKMKTAGLTTQRLEIRDDGKTNALTTVQKDTLVALKPQRVTTIKSGGQGDRVYSADGKAISLASQSGGTAGNGNMLVALRPCEPKNFDESALCHHVANATDLKGNDQIKRVYGGGGKSPTVNTCQGGHREPKVLVNVNPSGKGMNGREDSTEAKGPTLTTNKGEGPKISDTGLTYRKLTPLECERLQTVPDNYTASVSNSQRYKMLGNGWTVDVIAHIFKGLPYA